MDYTNEPDCKLPLALIVNMPELKVIIDLKFVNFLLTCTDSYVCHFEVVLVTSVSLSCFNFVRGCLYRYDFYKHLTNRGACSPCTQEAAGMKTPNR